MYGWAGWIWFERWVCDRHSEPDSEVRNTLSAGHFCVVGGGSQMEEDLLAFASCIVLTDSIIDDIIFKNAE